MKDVAVQAPPAIWGMGPSEKELIKVVKQLLPTADIEPKEVMQMQQARIRELEDTLAKTRVVATTIANSAVCMYKMLLDEGYTHDGESVVFPKDLVDRMKGAEISISEHNGDRHLRITARHGHPVWEGQQVDADL